MRPRRWNALQFFRSIPVFVLILPVSIASPVPPDAELLDLNNVTLAEKRVNCPNGILCGYYDQACCSWNERCYTNVHTIALCTPIATPAPEGGHGHWEYYTRTWVVTDRITKTKVYSSYVGGWAPATPTYYPPATTTQKEIHCSWGQHPCGPICCKSWQYCVVAGQCGGHHGIGYSYTPPLRPTSLHTVVHTKIIPHTTTVGFQPAVETGHHHGGGGVTISENSSSGGLSAGAIAGIVIGVIVGIIILIIVCLILCFASAWNALLAFFGLGPRRRRETVEVEEYHRHGSRSDGRRYTGSGRPPPPPRKKKSGFGWGTVILGLGALWAALGFRRRRERRKRRDEKSDYSSSGYYSDYTSESSDRRTRDTRRSSRR